MQWVGGQGRRIRSFSVKKKGVLFGGFPHMVGRVFWYERQKIQNLKIEIATDWKLCPISVRLHGWQDLLILVSVTMWGKNRRDHHRLIDDLKSLVKKDIFTVSVLCNSEIRSKMFEHLFWVCVCQCQWLATSMEQKGSQRELIRTHCQRSDQER